MSSHPLPRPDFAASAGEMVALIGLADVDGDALARKFRTRPDTAGAVLIAEHGRILSKAAGQQS